MNVWTDERIEKLKELWPTMPASEIAKILGVTRNAIIGKTHRLGLVKGQSVAPEKLAARKTEKAARKAKKPPVEKPAATAVPTVAVEAPVEQPVGIPLFDLRHDQCHWVIGEPENFSCCGAPASSPGSAWCAAHRKIVYVPPRNRNLSKLAKFYR